MNNYLDGMRHYVDFTGRASRAQFWQFMGIALAVVFVGIMIDYGRGDRLLAQGRLGLVSVLLALAHFVPFIAASVRRLHDSDKSGWLYWIVYIPFVGWIPFLILMVLPSTVGANRFDAPEGPTAGAQTLQDRVEPPIPAPKSNESYKAPFFGSYQQPPRDGSFTPAPLAQADAQRNVDAPVRPAAVSPKPDSQLIGQLERLAALRASGAIDDAEFAMMKADVLSRAS